MVESIKTSSHELAQQDMNIINDIRAGNSGRFDELVLRYNRKLYQIAYGVIGDAEDAEEIVQDAFIKAFKNLDNFRSTSTFYTWIRQIVLNAARDKYQWVRRRGRNQTVSISSVTPTLNETEINEDFQIPTENLSPEHLFMADETQMNIDRCFQKLPESMKDVMILRHLEDMSYEDIATELKCNLGTVKSRLARGREFLMTCLDIKEI